MREIEIRDARPEDAGRFCEIYNPYVLGTRVSFEEEAVSPEAMRQRVESKLGRYAWIVACEGERVQGYAYYGPWRERAAYSGTVETSVYLDEGARGRGLGRLLYGALLDRARAQARHVAMGVVALPNEASEALHRSFGFTRSGLFHEVGYKAGQWVDLAFWELRL
jgi:phosphinothricin acetyltransferase